MIPLFFLLISAASVSPARAGDVIGNGGHVLFCKGKAPVVLDQYEAEKFHPHSFGHLKGMAPEQVTHFVVEKLGASPFGRKFSSTLRQLGHPIDWQQVPRLELIPDHGPSMVIPNSCTLTQAALRKGTTVFLSQEVASQLSPEQLGILAVHEVVYKLSLESGAATTSTKARVVVKYLLSQWTLPDAYLGMIGYQHSTVESMPFGIYRGESGGKEVKAQLLRKNSRGDLLLSYDGRDFAEADKIRGPSLGQARFQCADFSDCTGTAQYAGRAIPAFVQVFGANGFELTIGGKSIRLFQ